MRPPPSPALARPLLAAPGDALPRPHGNCYWLAAGLVLAGEYPGHDDAATRDARLAGILACGVTAFVDLTAPSEMLPPYVGALDRLAAARGIAVAARRFPIVDFGVPTPADMRATLDTLYASVAAGRVVYLHCHGGVGRTGTVAGCLLVEQGFDGADALALLARKWQVVDKRARMPHSPETAAQRLFVATWGDASA